MIQGCEGQFLRGVKSSSPRLRGSGYERPEGSRQRQTNFLMHGDEVSVPNESESIALLLASVR
jgi:hypothetical protein